METERTSGGLLLPPSSRRGSRYNRPKIRITRVCIDNGSIGSVSIVTCTDAARDQECEIRNASSACVCFNAPLEVTSMIRSGEDGNGGGGVGSCGRCDKEREPAYSATLLRRMDWY
jgi:hypothetical protein